MSSISIAFVVWSKMLSTALTRVAGGVPGSSIILRASSQLHLTDEAAAQLTARRQRVLFPSTEIAGYFLTCLEGARDDFVFGTTSMTTHHPKPERLVMVLIITLVGAGVSTMAAGAVYLLVLLSRP
jgi:hypothetical protein